MGKPVQNPYRFGSPAVGANSFVGRADILKQVYRRLGQSVRARIALFGANNIGTTSVLLSIADPAVQMQYCGRALTDCAFISIDLKTIPRLSPESLSRRFLDAVSELLGERPDIADEPYTTVSRAAAALSVTGKQIVILIDEMDRLLSMGEEYLFMDSMFYALCNFTHNIHVITASRYTLSELFLRGESEFKRDLGSPYYIHFLPLRIGLFTVDERRELICDVSSRNGLSLEPDERRIAAMAGRFPAFLQLACYLVFDRRSAGSRMAAHEWSDVRREFEDHALPYYRRFWSDANNSEKRILSMAARGMSLYSFSDTFDSSTEWATKDAQLRFADDPLPVRLFDHVVSRSVNSELKHRYRRLSRAGQVSDWILSILLMDRGKWKLFSKSFEEFVRRMAADWCPNPVSVIVPGLLRLLYDNLRLHFQGSAPRVEAEVQKAIELILRAGGYEVQRESEQFRFSVRGWRPDLTLSRGIAIEAKLCKQKSDVSRVVEEISADIIPYRSRYDGVVVVVYDIGAIDSEREFCADFEKLAGVYVLIRKH